LREARSLDQASRSLLCSGALGSGRGSRSLVDNRSNLGRHALGHDHALATAVATGAAAADNLAAAAAAAAAHDLAAAAAIAGHLAARAAVAGSLAARAAVSGNLTVATTVLTEQATTVAPLAATVAPLAAMAGMELGEQAATMATATTMAAVAGHRAAVTANEGDGNQREEHRERETEKTLH
jgi:hypothetical protein